MLSIKKITKIGFSSIAVLALLAVSFLITKNSSAYVSGPDADGETGVMRGGTVEDFAKNAPISTINIDLASATDIELDQNPNHNPSSPEDFFIDDGGYVQLPGVKMKYGFSRLHDFTIIYKNAATISTGEKKDVEIIFKEIELAGKEGNGTYDDNVRLVKVDSDDGDKVVPSIRPQTEARKHFGMRGIMKVRIGKAGDFSSNDTFLFTLYGINNVRSGYNFETLFSAANNYNYSESVEQLAGISSESDVYVPEDFIPTEIEGHVEYEDIRFLAAGGNDQSYETGYAVTAEASGYETYVWSSAGAQGFGQDGMNMRIFPVKISHTSKSASSEGGKIELWTDGQVDSLVTKLEGGTTDLPRIYVVPNHKEVTYKMTPDAGYEFDTLIVNGVEVDPVEVTDEEGNVLYYTYTFNEDTLDDQEIIVTWKKLPVPPTPPEPTPDPDDPPVVPSVVPGGKPAVPGIPNTGRKISR